MQLIESFISTLRSFYPKKSGDVVKRGKLCCHKPVPLKPNFNNSFGEPLRMLVHFGCEFLGDRPGLDRMEKDKAYWGVFVSGRS